MAKVLLPNVRPGVGTLPTGSQAARAPALMGGMVASVASTYLFAIGLFVFVVAVITPVINAGRPDFTLTEEPQSAFSRAGLFFFLACLAGFLILNRAMARQLKGLALFLIGFAIVSFALSAVNNDRDLASRASFSAITIILFLAFRCAWAIAPDRRRRIYGGIAIVIWLQLIVGYLFYGSSFDRWVGGLHPNHFARFALCALFLWTLARGRLDVAPMAVTLVLVVLTSSRTSLIGLLIFVAIFGLASTREPGVNRKLAYALYGIILLFPVELLVNGTRHFGQLADQLAIFSDDRGIGSGMSGRTDTYSVLLDESASDAVLGMGFRYSRVAEVELHSGVLRNFYEFGLPLGIVFYAAILWMTARQLRTGLQPGRSTQRACSAFAIASLPMTFSEPDSIVIGFLASTLFLLALSCPTDGIVDTARAVMRQERLPLRLHA